MRARWKRIPVSLTYPQSEYLLTLLSGHSSNAIAAQIFNTLQNTIVECGHAIQYNGLTYRIGKKGE